jgi:addiction module RelB/DinJ family antitoxin
MGYFYFLLNNVDICGYFVYYSDEVIIMPNTRSSGMHIRVNPEIKASVEPILAAIGLSFSDVFNLTLRQIYLKRKIPFELSAEQLTENGYTPEFEAEVLRTAEEDYAAIKNGTATPYSNTAEMFAQWDKDDD